MKKILLSLLMVVVAVNSWGQSTNPNVQWNNGTLTITYYDGVIDDIKNESIFQLEVKAT